MYGFKSVDTIRDLEMNCFVRAVEEKPDWNEWRRDRM